jgi:hypothetical protein
MFPAEKLLHLSVTAQPTVAKFKSVTHAFGHAWMIRSRS